ncbi:hypothetical protein ABB37_04384 [Leptomonas pyrrhocoris]|uniref:Uncharacterized protein n=1 Tax=Leptomonas pyrrhocoris TaxID=157538 RepID=A0A0M9G2N7_LEPPY|nr:hypothetical protein ABB37_04384 [Leptomonas pyrrhocoris]KPA81003.1 hypothetical protein ABB37_04384 [Leptomonas pyrrhocoris]|eukprot:XP_015659442.1 hypothetical protein ABB37_04384 [Leptomonas pyrrhocoris]
MSAMRCNTQMQGFEVVDAVSHTRTNTSASLYAPLHFTISFQVHEPIVGSALFVAVEFIADVASEQPAVSLLPLSCVAPAGLANSSAKTATSMAAVTLTSSSSVGGDTSTDALPLQGLLAPDVLYELTFCVTDLSTLRVIPLKHLLQVSMMRVRLVTAAAATAATETEAERDENKRGESSAVATWCVVWHVRRDPQNNQELVRTVLSPLS